MTKLSLENLSKKKTLFFIGLSLIILSIMLAINVGYFCRALTYVPVYLFGLGAYLLYFALTVCGLLLIFEKKLYKIKRVSRYLGIVVIFTGITTIFSYMQNHEASFAGYKEIFSHGILCGEDYFKIKFIDIFRTYKVGGGFFGNVMCSVFLSVSAGFTKFMCAALVILGILLFFLNELKHLKFRFKNNKTQKAVVYVDYDNEINPNITNKEEDKFAAIKDSNRRRIAEASVMGQNPSERYLENSELLRQQQQSAIPDPYSRNNINSYSSNEKDEFIKSRNLYAYPFEETRLLEDYGANGSLEVAHFYKEGLPNKDRFVETPKESNNNQNYREPNYQQNSMTSNNLQTSRVLERATFNRTDYNFAPVNGGFGAQQIVNPNEQAMINHMAMNNSNMSSSGTQTFANNIPANRFGNTPEQNTTRQCPHLTPKPFYCPENPGMVCDGSEEEKATCPHLKNAGLTADSKQEYQQTSQEDDFLSSFRETNFNNDQTQAYNEPIEERKPITSFYESTPDGTNLDLFIRKPVIQKPVEEEPQNTKLSWKTPSLEILNNKVDEALDSVNVEAAETRMKIINDFFESRNIDTRIVRYKIGPRVTRFYVPYNNNVSVKTIMNIVPDIEVRVGTSVMFVQCVDVSTSGLDIANVKSTIVPFRTVMEKMPDPEKHPLAIPFGKSIDGEVLFDDFNKFPHLLLAGSTNSGKSNYIHSVICALLMRASPEVLKLAIIDPKFIEFARYNEAPHLLCPIVIDLDKAKSLLDKLVEEMNNRYQAFANCPNGSCTSLDEFNAYRKSIGKAPVPYIICVIDEYADLVDNVKNVDQPVNSIAAKARACGIFLFITTQRPSANILNGTIKSNVPVHIALKTSTSTDSQIILGVGGAEHLLGFGDMLIQDPGLFNGGDLLRCQAAMITKEESYHIIDYLKERYKPEYDEFFLNLDERKSEGCSEYGARDLSSIDDDPIFPDILNYLATVEYCSASKLIQRYPIGSTKASKFIARLIEIGALENNFVSNAGYRVSTDFLSQRGLEELNNRTVATSREQSSFDFENRYN